MRFRILLLPLLIAMVGGVDRSLADDFPCPEPTAQTDSNLKADITGKAQTILKVADADLQGHIETTVNNLYAQYPNADRVAVIRDMISTTCNLIKHSSQLSDSDKFNKWITTITILRSYLPTEKQGSYQEPNVDLDQFGLGEERKYIESIVGQPKYINTLQISTGEQDKKGVYLWKDVKEYIYIYAGVDIRVMYGSDGTAISVFVGLAGDPKLVTVSSFGDWPLSNPPVTPIKWSQLRFDNLAEEGCSSEVHTGASNGLLFVTCNYSQPKHGFAHEASNFMCFFEVGESDGALDVYPSDNPPEWSEFDVDPMIKAGKTEEEIQKVTWQHVFNRNFNYFMVTCDENLLKTSW